METFHPETNKNLLQKWKISKNNFKITKIFKTFFIAKGSLPFSKFWNPEEECFRAEAEKLRLRLRPRLWLRLMLRLTQAEAQFQPELRRSLETWVWTSSLAAWDWELKIWDLRSKVWGWRLEAWGSKLEARSRLPHWSNSFSLWISISPPVSAAHSHQIFRFTLRSLSPESNDCSKLSASSINCNLQFPSADMTSFTHSHNHVFRFRLNLRSSPETKPKNQYFWSGEQKYLTFHFWDHLWWW